MKSIVIYVTPTCAFSAAALSFLLARGADWRVVNLDQHPDQREALQKRVKGKLETPVFEVDGQYHVAPPLSELKTLLEQWGLSDQAAPHSQLKQARQGS